MILKNKTYNKSKTFSFNILFAIFCLVVILNAWTIAGANDIKSLLFDSKGYDGRDVTIQGEVVGDIMLRENGVWINIDDGTESIGVWSSKDLLPEIRFTGDYKAKGDILEIDGTFNRACLMHGGDTDIHTTEIKNIKFGYPIKHRLTAKKVDFAILFSLISILIMGFYFWQKKREKGIAKEQDK